MFGFSACMTKKKLDNMKTSYEIFRTGLDSLGSVPMWEERIILPGDVLSIVIATESLNISQVEVFGNGRENKYSVTNDTSIIIPIIGKIKIGGNNRITATQIIKNELAKVIKNPIVQIQPLEIQVLVFGQSERQLVVSIAEKEANLLKALTLAGGVNQFSKRDSLLVIREKGGTRKVIPVDLRDAQKFYASEAYRLENNDVILVKPNDYFYKQIKNTENTINLGRLTPLTTILGIFFFLLPVWSFLTR